MENDCCWKKISGKNYPADNSIVIMINNRNEHSRKFGENTFLKNKQEISFWLLIIQGNRMPKKCEYI